MIINIQKFVETERPYWNELESILEHSNMNPQNRMELSEIRRFHYLYQRTSNDLAKISSFASEKEIRSYLETLTAQAYEEIHETRSKARVFKPHQWFLQTFPQVFRRNIQCFWISLAVTLLGVVFGGLAITLDPEAKGTLMPFSHLQGSPTERVIKEETNTHDALQGHKAAFSSQLMTHNTKVSIFTLSMGMTWGIGTFILLFYNGVILGAVGLDYILAGQTKFLLGWLMPHGTIEIPAILIAGQGGFLLASAMIGWESRLSITERLRAITSDLATLIGGAATLLIWAGFVESFLSQYHEPVIPYTVKILFGFVELILLGLLLSLSGRKQAVLEKEKS